MWTSGEGTGSDGRGIGAFLARCGPALIATDVPTLVVGAGGAVRLVNPAACAILGAPASLVPLVPDAERVWEACTTDGWWEGPLSGHRALVVPIPGERDGFDGLLARLASPDDDRVAGAFATGEDARVWVGADGRVVGVNRSAARLFGPRLLGRPATACLPSGACAALATREDVVQPFGNAAFRWSAAVTDGGEVALRARDVTPERDLEVLRERDRWRCAVHAVALAAGRGRPALEIAEEALERLEGLLGPGELRVTLIEGDALRVLAARRHGERVHVDGRALLALSPASEARARRSVEQCVVAESLTRYPSLRTLVGVRGVLYVPLEVAEAVAGFFELHSDTREAFPPEEIAAVREMASVLATAMVREQVADQYARHVQAMEAREVARREELRGTQEQLIHAARLSSIGELAAGLVHEINQPLNVLGGYIELLREGNLPEGARVRALEVMSRAVDRMISMADNLRNFARASARTERPVDVANVLAMARELTVGALKRGVQVECAPDLTVLGDANRLEQVLVNLLANALQAEGDPVHVRGRELDGARVVIEVSDRGPGVPPELRSRIFDPFFTTRPAGTGLGLAVSARIVQEHGGRIEVDENPGGGALFRVVLPRHQPRGADVAS